MEDHVLIVGGGHAGCQTAFSLREAGWAGAITLIGEEPHLPYHRPPLSKAYIKGDVSAARLALKPEQLYEKHIITWLSGRAVAAINPAEGRVEFCEGGALLGSHIVLATGAEPRALRCPGAHLPQVLYMRSLADAERLKVLAKPGQRLVVIGGGYIGLEAAAVARAMGLEVTLLEASERILARVSGPILAARLQELHEARGVQIHTSAQVAQITGQDHVTGVALNDGRAFAADLVLVGIGVEPRTALAKRAGLEVEGGILVDARGRTKLSRLSAAGDCTLRNLAEFGLTMRVESVHNAQEQARAIAADLCGKPAPEPECPWFWSDQYEVKLQTAGILSGFEGEVLRPGATPESYSIWYLRQGRVVACDALNAPREFNAAKKLIRNKCLVPADALADPQHNLLSLLAEPSEDRL